MTTPERWRQIERMYHEALTLDERERRAFIRDNSGGDADIVREVESLLDCDDAAQGLLHGEAIDTIAAAYVSHDIPEPLIGHRLGSYAISSLIGFGGMGDVYRARDTKLGRDVAIKILPEMFAADAERRARFEREARVLAALNHPHIATIYGFEDGSQLHALVLELVEGHTLHERLRSGPIEMREVLTIASQIASALEAAHAKGIVHRDLKPRNIALSAAGAVKILDFGLAKGALDEADWPASRDAQTRDGTLLGTTGYMSPEQVKGVAAEKEADIWSFGCVLVEMLTGRRTFAGSSTASGTIAAILEHDPPWHLLPAETPRAVVALAQQCLERDSSRRLHDIGEARIVLTAALNAANMRWPTGWWVAIAAVATALVAGIALEIRRFTRPVAPTRLSLSVPGSISPQLSATLSPDGRRVAFVATGGSEGLMLWIRDLDASEPRALPGTDNAAHPFWSPDGRYIGFLSGGKVKTVGVDSGSVSVLADTAERAGPSWSRAGQILFVSRLGELGVISERGGPVSTVVANPGAGRQATLPYFLPDGRHFLFFMRSPRVQERGVYVGSLDSTATSFVLQSEFKGAYAAGHLLFVRDHTLMAQPFDLTRLTLTGTPVRIADGVWTATGAGQASFSVAETGAIAFVNASVSHRQMAWFDRNGRALEHVGASARYIGTPELARDARRVLVTQGEAAAEQILSFDVETDKTAVMTTGRRHVNAVWAPDGKRFASQSPPGVSVTNVDGSGREEAVLASDQIVALTDWSPDGRYLVFSARGPRSLSDLWLLPLDGIRAVPFLETAFNKTQAKVSPDGHWIAYTSYESGSDEIYVDRFPSPGSRRRVSVSGGVQPRWRRDGRELYYLAPDARLMAVRVEAAATFETSSPEALFKTRALPQGSQSIGLSTMYDVSPDGRRFLFFIPADDAGSPISVILNWRF